MALWYCLGKLFVYNYCSNMVNVKFLWLGELIMNSLSTYSWEYRETPIAQASQSLKRSTVVIDVPSGLFCSGFLPVAVNFLRRIPVIGTILNLPGISYVSKLHSFLCVRELRIKIAIKSFNGSRVSCLNSLFTSNLHWIFLLFSLSITLENRREWYRHHYICIT